jgi:hypothetical protein
VAKINAGFDEIADDKHALSSAQREEMEAQIASDMLIAECAECALIWAAETTKGEILDFRADTVPMAALGVALRTVPRAPNGSSPETRELQPHRRIAMTPIVHRAACVPAPAPAARARDGRPSRATSITNRAVGLLGGPSVQDVCALDVLLGAGSACCGCFPPNQPRRSMAF